MPSTSRSCLPQQNNYTFLILNLVLNLKTKNSNTRAFQHSEIKSKIMKSMTYQIPAKQYYLFIPKCLKTDSSTHYTVSSLQKHRSWDLPLKFPTITCIHLPYPSVIIKTIAFSNSPSPGTSGSLCFGQMSQPLQLYYPPLPYLLLPHVLNYSLKV